VFDSSIAITPASHTPLTLDPRPNPRRAESMLRLLCTIFDTDTATCALLTGECIYIVAGCGALYPCVCPDRWVSRASMRACHACVRACFLCPLRACLLRLELSCQPGGGGRVSPSAP